MVEKKEKFSEKEKNAWSEENLNKATVFEVVNIEREKKMSDGIEKFCSSFDKYSVLFGDWVQSRKMVVKSRFKCSLYTV